MIDRSTNVRAALKRRQRGFIIDPYRFGPAIVAEAASIYPNLRAWWSMDDNAASITVLDSHTNVYNAQTVGGFNTSAFSSTAAVKYVRDMVPSGTNAAIIVPRSNTNFDFGDVSFSIGLWFRFGAYTAFAGGFTIPIMGRAGGASNFCYYLSNSRDSVSPIWGFNTTDNATGTVFKSATQAASTSPIGIWYFLVGVHDATANEVRLYVNNTKSTTATTAGVYAGGTANLSWYAGIRDDSTQWDASRVQASSIYEEAFVCTAALTDAEVSYLYNSGTGRSYAGLKTDSGN